MVHWMLTNGGYVFFEKKPAPDQNRCFSGSGLAVLFQATSPTLKIMTKCIFEFKSRLFQWKDYDACNCLSFILICKNVCKTIYDIN